MKKGIASLIGLSAVAIILPIQACQPVPTNNSTVLSFEVTPTKVFENDRFTVSAVINNTSKDEVTFIVPVMVNGIGDERETMTLSPGNSQKVTFTLQKSLAGTYEIRIGDKSSSVFVEKVIPASFKLSDLAINMAVANPGEEVVITARVVNTGGSKGSYIAELKINGVPVESDRAVMEAGSVFIPVFKVNKTEPGTYTVGIGDLTATYTVQKPSEIFQVTAPAPEAQERVSRWPKGCGPGGCSGGSCQ
jgi:large repetitive protein